MTWQSAKADAETMAARILERVRALPEATVRYKSVKAFGPALLAWLDARSQ